jgi:hypothetical protein
MANTFITPQLIARRALATLYNTTVLAGLVYRDYDPDFAGKQGDTVDVRTPAIFDGKTFNRTAGIELQPITEGSFPVVLDTIVDVSFPVTVEELTLEIDDFAGRVLNPAMEAISQRIDGDLAEALVDAAEGAGGGGTAAMTSVASDAIIQARVKLSRNKLPITERYAVLSPEGQGVALSDELFVQANKSGSTDALREASIGRVFGIDTYESQVFGLGPGDRGQADGVAFHRSSVALVSRTLELPLGAAPTVASVENNKGFGLRVVKDYDIHKKQDVISIDVLYGIKATRPQGSVQLDFHKGS